MSAAAAWWQHAVAAPDAAAMQAARRRQAQLTKPAGSLGALETLAIRLAGLQGRACPRLDHVHISVFAADHGVAAENVSAFPQAVTAQMIDNFAAGGGAINVLARQLGASLEVIDLGTVAPSRGGDIVRREHIAPATANLAQQPAMSMVQLQRGLASGRNAVERATVAGAQLFIGGEMGIANTTAATALTCQLLNLAPAQLTGPGTGLDASGVAHKTRVIETALRLHGPACTTPLEALRRLGGFEIAALTGALIAAAQRRLPVLVDGYIVGVSALVATRLVERVGDWLIHSHRSAEPGHRSVLAALDARPLLDLDLRLGEGSGAAIAVPLLRLACALHGEMATFSDAQVATGNA
ncbi:nicotinate-nucleotide--dimethylbenzimidazole phosphoribosyltransferase [Panacagrimonas sp.]|uniref:nicotinate-nucleotide--dimethylbenzimidazole phosphoribosyltransferase n=1 Tax=Panacagrimonas sp. TaxID=2480088 RepID=UPI003B5228EC